MNDEQMQSLLEEEFRTLDTTPKDVESSTRRVMERKAGVRQRSRWWPFPVFYRRHDTPTATDKTDDQPSPIPASNGHTPTVIGRTTSMLSPVKAITAGAIVFAIGGVMLIAQPFGQLSSAPAATVDVAPAWVTGTAEFPTGCDRGAPIASEDDVIHESFVCPGRAWTADDPRLTGVMRKVWTLDGYRTESDGYRSVVVSRYTMDTEDGTWECESVQVGSGTGITANPLVRDTMTCVGDGAHEGLTAIVQVDWGEVGYPFEALVFSGAVPPAPDASDFE